MTITRISPALLSAQRRGTQRRHKFNAKPTVMDGVRYDSQKEANEAARLNWLLKAGVISQLEPQPVYELHAPGGEVIGQYRADFRYLSSDGREVVVDVKGFKTPLYRWKKRHAESEYGIRIEER